MATEREKSLFASQVLAAVGRQSARLPPDEVTGFLAMAGNDYERALMVVGRAVNGWTEGIRPSQLTSPRVAEHYADLVFTSVIAKKSCPMCWVTDSWGAESGDYNTRRSAFWRAIRDVVKGLQIADVEQAAWPSRLVWSNLYKVAPAKGGNPGNALCYAQLSSCIALFKLELMTYEPRRLLFLTGSDWAAPFIPTANSTWERESGFSYVEDAGRIELDAGISSVQYVVAAHPQGKPIAGWVEEVLIAYSRI